MLLDAKLIFAESYDLGAASVASTVALTDKINLGLGEDSFGSSQTPDISNDGEIWWNVICEDEDFASAGSPVVTYTLRTADNASMSSASTLLTMTTDKTPNDGDVIGSKVVPAGTVKQYVDVTVGATAELTAGKTTSWLSGSPLTDQRLG